MLWLGWWMAILAVAAVGVLASANSLRFRRRVAREAVRLWANAPPPLPLDRGALADLPPPVRRYAEVALGARGRALRSVRLRHGGTFRTRLDGAWLPIRGLEYFGADPPGLVWWGRVRVAPGLWVEALDRSVAGVGGMLVSAESTVTLQDRTGPDLDQGGLLRVLAELPWIPTAFFDGRYVTWTARDDRRAEARLQVSGRAVDGVFEFGEDGLPSAFLAHRYRDLGDGRSVLTPWSGEYADFRDVGGLRLPHRVVVSWRVEGSEVPYVRFVVEGLELDPALPD
jgi:uncharacterized protein DUF6544